MRGYQAPHESPQRFRAETLRESWSAREPPPPAAHPGSPLQSTLVFYEAPHRILDTLGDIAEILGARPVVVGREITKIHEEFLRGTAAEINNALGSRASVKGEMVLMIGKGETQVDDSPIEAAVEKLVQSGASRMEACKTVARQRGLSKREVYKLINER